MKLRFILNPRSGANARSPRLLADIETFLRVRQLDGTVVLTNARGHAPELSRAAALEGCERVVALGGAGTVNEVAQGLLGTRAALGIVPRGSGNGLARHLGLPRRLLPALANATSPAALVLPIDSGTANGRLFLTAMGVGFDAEVVHRFNELSARGFPAYVKTTFRAWHERPTLRCTVSAAGAKFELEALLISVLNSDQYGNNVRPAPGARIDDGLLDLMAIRPLTLTSATLLAPRLFLGGFDRSSRVVRLTSPHFVIERPAPGLLHTDGETHHAPARVEIAVAPRSLCVVVPPSSRLARTTT
jgi:YegS/Rv2252/BmrU family lipid kinase